MSPPQESPTLYVSNGVHQRWLEEAVCAGEMLMFSPFVTGPIAQQILSNKNIRPKLYTTFSARTFASKGSSLETLEELLNHADLFEVRKLHAKIMLIPGRLATIGSQNLTKGGEGNREASVAITDVALLRAIEAEVAPWIRDAQPITLDRITPMKERVAQLRNLWSQFDTEARRDENKIRKNQMIESVRGFANRATTVLHGVVRKDEHTRESYRLYFDANSSLDNLRPIGGIRALRRMERYLCINEATGMLGWVRLANTEITLVSNEIPWDFDVDIDGDQSPTRFVAAWNDRDLETHNVTIGLRWKRGACDVKCLFNVAGLTAVDCAWSTTPYDDGFDVVAYINTDQSGIRGELESLLVGLHENLPGDKLDGEYAHHFFGDAGTRWTLHVVGVRGSPVLVARQHRERQ